MKKIETKFPSQPDDRLFIHDVDLSSLATMQSYNALISKDSYTEASELLNDSDVFFYGAWLVNYFEDRLNVLGSFLLEQGANEEKPVFFVYQDDEPEDIEVNQAWIGDGG